MNHRGVQLDFDHAMKRSFHLEDGSLKTRLVMQGKERIRAESRLSNKSEDPPTLRDPSQSLPEIREARLNRDYSTLRETQRSLPTLAFDILEFIVTSGSPTTLQPQLGSDGRILFLRNSPLSGVIVSIDDSSILDYLNPIDSISPYDLHIYFSWTFRVEGFSHDPAIYREVELNTVSSDAVNDSQSDFLVNSLAKTAISPFPHSPG